MHQRPGHPLGRGVAERGAEAAGFAAPGLHVLEGVASREALLYVPATSDPARATPLLVMLHGAGGDARQGIDLGRGLADAGEMLLLATTSQGATWDIIRGAYGPDVVALDAALARAAAMRALDPAQVWIGGFSDGASYALSLGAANGDLFTHVIAFAPGFMAPATPVGKPRLFVSHGTRDTVLPIDRCSRAIVPRARRAGYDVTYREFDGPHSVPPEVALEAVRWFPGPNPAAGLGPGHGT